MKSFSKLLIQDFQEKANLTMALICRIMTILMGITIILNFLGIFKISHDFYPALVVSIVILLIPTVLYK